MKIQVSSLASLSGSRIWCCRELWHTLQMRLGSCVAVAVVYSSNSNPSLGTSICCKSGSKNKWKKGRKKERKEGRKEGKEKADSILRWNPHHSSDQSHSSDNAGSLTCWATRELPSFFINKKFALWTISNIYNSGWNCWTYAYIVLNSWSVWLHPSLPMYLEANLRDHVVSSVNINKMFLKVWNDHLKHSTIIMTKKKTNDDSISSKSQPVFKFLAASNMMHQEWGLHLTNCSRK